VYGLRWQGTGSEQKPTMERLEPDADRLREICDVTADWSYTLHIEADGTTVGDWTSPDVQRVTGFTLAELGGTDPWIRLVHPEDRPAMRAHLEALQTGRTDVVEYRIRTRSGETRWIRDYGRPLGHDADGSVHVVGGVRDITARRQAETDRARLLTELEACEERLEGFLRALEVEVASAVEAVEGVQTELKDATASARIGDVSRRLTDLRRRLAKLTALDGIEESPVPVHLGPLAEEAVGRREALLRERGVERTVGRLPVVYGDRVRIRELVELLLERALAASGNGGAHQIEVGCRTVADGLATIFVRHDGPDATMDSGRDAAEMLLARRIVELHGGQLWLEPGPGGAKGTVVFQLPA
jgi:PAS domain S-box-containing protein